MQYCDVYVGELRTVARAESHFIRRGFVYPYIYPKKHLEILYISEGEWEIFENERPVLMGAGDVYVLLPGNNYRGEKRSSDNLLLSSVGVVSHVDDCLVEAFSKKSISGKHVRLPVQMNISDGKLLLTYFERIQHYFHSESLLDTVRASALFIELLVELALMYEPDAGNSDVVMQKMRSMIEKNIGQNLTINDLAGHAKMHPKTFEKKFKQAIGKSVHQYQMDHKLRRSLLLLESPGLSIKDIADTLGFYDQHHFRRFFMTRMGCSPKAYHKKQQSTY